MSDLIVMQTGPRHSEHSQTGTMGFVVLQSWPCLVESLLLCLDNAPSLITTNNCKGSLCICHPKYICSIPREIVKVVIREPRSKEIL